MWDLNLFRLIVSDNKIDYHKAYEYLDLVAVSIASDIVPIIGENRVWPIMSSKTKYQSECRFKAIIKVAECRGAKLQLVISYLKLAQELMLQKNRLGWRRCEFTYYRR